MSGDLTRTAFAIPGNPLIGAIMRALVGDSVFIHADDFLVPTRAGAGATPFSGNRSGE